MTVQVSAQNIVRCPHCHNTIARRVSPRTNRWYVINLPRNARMITQGTVTTTTADSADLHRCPRITDIGALLPVPLASAPASSPNVLGDLDHFPTPAIPAHTAAINVESMIQARGTSRPMTREALLDLRKGIIAALDVFAVATARYEVEVNGASVDTATASYWHQMRSIINAQIDGLQTGYKVIDAINRGEISGEIRTDASGYAAHHCDGCGIPVPAPGFCSACIDAMPTSTEDLPPSDTHAATAAVYVDTVVADAVAGRIDLDAVIAASTDTPMDRETRLEVAASRAEMEDANAPWVDRWTDGGDLVALEAAANAHRPAGANDWPSDADVPF